MSEGVAVAEAQPKEKKFARQMAVLRNFVRGNGAKKSAMRFNPFELFDSKTVAIEEHPEDKTRLFNVVRYTHARPQFAHSVASAPSVTMLERRECGTTVSDIRTAAADGVDNTGNFHWPAEEVLAHLLLNKHYNNALVSQGPDGKDGSAILELGAGFGLCGYFLSSLGYQSVVTDGNSSVVETLGRNVERLGLKEKCSARLLPWQDPETYTDLVGTTGLVVGADCLFFSAFHDDLVRLLYAFAKGNINTSVIFVAPSRGGSLERFVEKMTVAFPPGVETITAELEAQVSIKDDVDEYMAARHAELTTGESPSAEYESDRHRPKLVEITFRSKE